MGEPHNWRVALVMVQVRSGLVSVCIREQHNLATLCETRLAHYSGKKTSASFSKTIPSLRDDYFVIC
jgi:hypothetical protein